MEKVSSTGRETYNSQIGKFSANYTKTTTASNVVVSVDVTNGEEVVYTSIYDKTNNRCTSSFKKFDSVTPEERVTIVSQVMTDINSIV